MPKDAHIELTQTEQWALLVWLSAEFECLPEDSESLWLNVGEVASVIHLVKRDKFPIAMALQNLHKLGLLERLDGLSVYKISQKGRDWAEEQSQRDLDNWYGDERGDPL